jgi:hypothetical protein
MTLYTSTHLALLFCRDESIPVVGFGQLERRKIRPMVPLRLGRDAGIVSPGDIKYAVADNDALQQTAALRLRRSPPRVSAVIAIDRAVVT